MKLKNVVLTGVISSIIATNDWRSHNHLGCCTGHSSPATRTMLRSSAPMALLLALSNGGSTLAANAVVNGVEFVSLAGTNAGGQNLVSGPFSFLNHNDNASAFGQGGFSGGTAGVGDLIQSGIWGARGTSLWVV